MKILKAGHCDSIRGMMLFVAVLFFTLLPVVVQSRAILGVDLGSLYMKVALVQSGSPLEIVTNMHSKRKTEQMILFEKDSSRYYGADASSLLARKSNSIPSAMSLMLGRDELHPSVQVLTERHYPIRPIYNESRYGVVLKIDGHTFTPEELVAMVLTHAVDISVAYSIESSGKAIPPPRDVVLTVPSFATQKERLALQDAAELASLNVLSLIDENTAAALHYAMDKTFDNEQLILFYNMGGSSLQVSLIRFFQYLQPQKYGQPKSIPALEVLGKSWDTTLGGDAYDHIIVEMLVDHFNEKWRKQTGDNTNDVRKVPRAMTKIRLQANKVKHVLSANSEIPVHIDSVHDDLSISFTITREEFEQQMIEKKMISRSIQPVIDVLNNANKTINDLYATELLGGGMRIPKIQNELQKYLNDNFDAKLAAANNSTITEQVLGMHINADESFALGAAFAGANISTAFRVRQVGLTDINPFPIQVTLTDMPEEEKKSFFGTTKKKPEEDSAVWSKEATIFKAFGKYGVKKTIAFTHDKDVVCSLDYVNTTTLPAGTEPELERYSIKGIVDFVKEMTDKKVIKTDANATKPKVSLQFELSTSGIASLIKAEVSMEELYIAQEEIEVDDNSTDTTTNNTNTTEDNVATEEVAATNETESNNTSSNTTTTDKKKDMPKKKKTIKVEKEKKRVHRKSLDVKISYVTRVRPHTVEELAASKEKLLSMAQRDKERMLLQESKNKVESYIYKIKNKLIDDEEVVASVTTEEQREEVSQLARDAEMWLEDDGYDADLATMDAKYTELSSPFEKILLRINELTARPAALEAMEKKFKEIEDLMVLWNTTKPHITDVEKDMVLKQVTQIREDISKKVEEQSLLKPHEEPVLVSTDLPEKTKLVETLIVALSSKKPPAPKKDKKKKGKKNATTTVDINATNADFIFEDDNSTEPSTNTTTETSDKNSTSAGGLSDDEL